MEIFCPNKKKKKKRANATFCCHYRLLPSSPDMVKIFLIFFLVLLTSWDLWHIQLGWLGFPARASKHGTLSFGLFFFMNCYYHNRYYPSVQVSSFRDLTIQHYNLFLYGPGNFSSPSLVPNILARHLPICDMTRERGTRVRHINATHKCNT